MLGVRFRTLSTLRDIYAAPKSRSRNPDYPSKDRGDREYETFKGCTQEGTKSTGSALPARSGRQYEAKKPKEALERYHGGVKEMVRVLSRGRETLSTDLLSREVHGLTEREISRLSRATRFQNRDLGIRIGIAIHGLRESSRLTQAALGDRVGITQSAVSQIENGKRMQNLNTLESISLALGLRFSDMIRIAEHPDDPKKFIKEILESSP